MCSQSENSKNKPKIKFVKHLKLYCEAICLYWIDEIHIDESYRDSPLIDDIIKHELKHYDLIKKVIQAKESRNELKASLLMAYNNLFDVFDTFRLFFKILRLKLCKKQKKK